MDKQNVEKDEKIESSTSISSNDLFTTIYDISRAIFRHLPIRSVDSCSLVCQSWAHIARFTKTHRHTIHTLTYPSNLSSSTTKCSYDVSDFDTIISSYINDNLWSLPSLALVVATNGLDRKGFISSSSSPPPTKNSKRSRSQTRARQAELSNIPQALIRHLNKSCKILQVASNGIVVSNDENQSYEIELDSAMGILLFPQFPSNVLGIYSFEIPCNTKIPADMSRSDLHHLLGCVPNDIPIRCVIFFFTQRQSHSVDCVKKLLEYYPSDVAIIGGFVDKIRYNDRQSQSKQSLYNTCGIVLTGEPNHLSIKQIVLESHIDTRETVKNKLKQLKSIENNQDLSFAIQVSCVARGSEFYHEEKNVECSEFRNLFPKTPLIGIFGNGELGHDYSLNDNQTSTQERINTKTEIDDIFHAYSTVFSLISLRM
ncbi:unnamed protein product [Rotaria sordida]|uniref:F-box domain-containing protein n=1 Tax=Rotaria sordida TaxID=392033 RepID=A0A819BZ82_9BILA|nr:unnamed protein product [Rotaria sordida]CAF0948679.1 unnamed protein product [Rotaria sordida]CAF0962695.1 unnamed protein product [Rotaria sordida]CAF1019370.1 unnamed protein product [Rotaria sordida]CAF1074156.1 unnamed protein product [Rotaria sordida]